MLHLCSTSRRECIIALFRGCENAALMTKFFYHNMSAIYNYLRSHLITAQSSIPDIPVSFTLHRLATHPCPKKRGKGMFFQKYVVVIFLKGGVFHFLSPFRGTT